MANPQGERALSMKEADIPMMLAAEVQLGTKNCDFQMERYVFKRRTDGVSGAGDLWPSQIAEGQWVSDVVPGATAGDPGVGWTAEPAPAQMADGRDSAAAPPPETIPGPRINTVPAAAAQNEWVDLFFYREQAEEEAPAAGDYGDYTPVIPSAGDLWPSQISEDQWVICGPAGDYGDYKPVIPSAGDQSVSVVFRATPGFSGAGILWPSQNAEGYWAFDEVPGDTTGDPGVRWIVEPVPVQMAGFCSCTSTRNSSDPGINNTVCCSK